MNRKEQQVEELLAPTVESLGCVIWGVEFLNQGKHSKLRLYIDRPQGGAVPNDSQQESQQESQQQAPQKEQPEAQSEAQSNSPASEQQAGVTVDDCAAVSRHVSDILDVEEFSATGYALEVSSPGMDRILFKACQYHNSVGEQVDVRLNFPFAGRKKFVGVLAGIEDNNAVVQIDDEEYLLPLENIQRARIVPTFEQA